MKRYDPVLLSELMTEWQGAPRGGRGPVLAKHLPALGLSEAGFYRLARRWCGMADNGERRDKGRLMDPRREEWVQAIIQMKHRPPNGVRTLTTEDAQRLVARGRDAEEAGEIMAIPAGSINRIAREMGLVDRPRRENRYQAGRPNHVHQFDASGSEHFFPWRQDNSGEWLLKLRPRKMKNKEKAEHLKVWAYGLCDDFSGVRFSRYTVAAGESALDGIHFLQWAWARLPEHAPFEGLPEILYMDNGPISKLLAFRKFTEAVMVEVQTHEPYRSQATGKVENNWRNAWKRFENLYFADPGWQQRVLSLSELNQEFCNFWRGWNQRVHRSLQVSREGAWLLINRRGGPATVHPAAWEKLATQQERTLDASGCFDLDGQTYQVRELYACRVTVLRGLMDGQVWVKDEVSRQRARAEIFAPAQWGEFRGSPKSELEQLQAQDEAVAEAQRPVFFPGGESNVVPLVRAGEVRGGEAVQSAKFKVQSQGVQVQSLADLAQGVEVLTPRAEEPQDFGSPLERYEFVLGRQFKGKQLTREEIEFLGWFRREYRDMLSLVGSDLEAKVRANAIS